MVTTDQTTKFAVDVSHMILRCKVEVLDDVEYNLHWQGIHTCSHLEVGEVAHFHLFDGDQSRVLLPSRARERQTSDLI